MPERKSYGQFCGLARSLDRVGDRWTLLVVRELLLGPRTFRQLQDALGGMSPSLLTLRIAALVADGLAERNSAPRRSKAVTYALTPAGQALEPVVLELIRWGSRWMTDGPGHDRSEPAWAPLALRALLGDRPVAGDATLHLDVEGTWVTVSSRRGRRSVAAGRHGMAHATVATLFPTALAVAAGAMELEGADAAVTGDRGVAARLLQPGSLAGDGPA